MAPHSGRGVVEKHAAIFTYRLKREIGKSPAFSYTTGATITARAFGRMVAR
jgi:hypothetical protein